MSWSKDEIAVRGAQEIEDGSIVNLGIGLPTLVANHLDDRADVWIHTENGILGMGPFPYEGDEDQQVINAGKQTVTIVPGGSCFDSATSFGMIRGGHVDLAILGAMQVGANGDLANWQVPGGKTLGIGGAMDLAAGAKRLVVLMSHASKKGDPKLVSRCTFPLTAPGVVARVITELGVFDPAGDGFRVIERAPGVDRDRIEAATGAPVTD